MVSITNNMVENKALYELLPAVLEGFNFTGVTFNAASPAEEQLMQAGVSDGQEARDLESLREQFIKEIENAAGLGENDPSVKAAIASLKTASTKGDLMSRAGAARDIAASAGERASDRIDGETTSQRIDRNLNDIRALAKENDEQMKKVLPHASQEQKDALAEAQAELDAAKRAGDKAQIAAAEAKLASLQASVANDVADKHPRNPQLADAAGKVSANADIIAAKAEAVKKDFAEINANQAASQNAAPRNQTDEQRAEVDAGLAMLRPANKEVQAPANTPAPIIQGTVALPMLQGVVVSEVEAPEANQLAALTTRQQTGPGQTLAG